MDNLSTANIDCHMVYPTIFCIEYQISRLCIGKTYLRPHLCLGGGVVRQADAIFFKDTHGKTGTVCTACKVRTAPYVRIANELFRILYQ